jgi:hypothetical protein
MALLALGGCDRPALKRPPVAVPLYRFDFGPPAADFDLPGEHRTSDYARFKSSRELGGVTAPGWIGIHLWSAYDPKLGYGWTPPPRGDHYARNDLLNPLYHLRHEIGEYSMLMDGLMIDSGNSSAFRLDLDPGEYEITVYLGDLSLGEGRRQMMVVAGGRALADPVDTAGGEIKVVAGRITVSTDPLLLQFTSGDPRSHQVSVSGLEVHRADTPSAWPTVRSIPEELDKPDTAARNLADYAREQRALWQAAVDVLADLGLPARQDQFPAAERGATQVLLTMYGDVSRLLALDRNLDISGMVELVRDTGVDAICVHAPEVARQYKAGGFSVWVSKSAERLRNAASLPPQQLRKRDGTLATLPGFFSTFSKPAQESLRQDHLDAVLAMRPWTDALFIDEPRGMTFTGGLLGDYSPDALVAFARWSAEQGVAEWAVEGGPAPGYTDAFYAFHRFRFEGVPMLLNALYEGSPIEDLPKMPGNGRVSPAYVHHNTFYPGAVARAGYGCASWIYEDPALAKASAEAVAAAREYGARSGVFTSVGSRDPRGDLLLGLVALSARPDILGPREGHDFANVMKLAALARAIGNRAHACGIHLYWPESLIFPDLVDYSEAEGRRWNEQARTLFDQNVDFKVSLRARMNEPALLVYAPVRPVLAAREIADLRDHLQKGGTLVTAFERTPVRPDGSILEDWKAELRPPRAEQIIELDRFPSADELRAMAAARRVAVNPTVTHSDRLLSFRFSGAEGDLVLIANREPGKTLGAALEWVSEDYFTKEEFSNNGQITIPAGGFRLLRLRGATDDG